VGNSATGGQSRGGNLEANKESPEFPISCSLSRKPAWLALASGRQAERRSSDRANLSLYTRGRPGALDQSKPGKIAQTRGKPQDLCIGERVGIGARGISTSVSQIPGNLVSW